MTATDYPDAFTAGRQAAREEWAALKRNGYGASELRGMAASDLSELDSDIALVRSRGDDFHCAFLDGFAAGTRAFIERLG